jgi:UDP-N-acetylglucosamine 2-epimerase (non-hydrolysing)
VTTKNIKLLIVAGARPNFMKIAPIIRAITESNRLPRAGDPALEYRLVHTGQHYDANMSDVFFRELGIPAPDINLEIGGGTHAIQTANVMLRFEPVCQQEKPDWIVVVGDVNSTLACTLVGVKLGIRVANVEAGLRSFDRAGQCTFFAWIGHCRRHGRKTPATLEQSFIFPCTKCLTHKSPRFGSALC